MGQIPSIPDGCGACRELNIDDLLNPLRTGDNSFGYCSPGYTHWGGWAQLAASAATCYVCRVIRDELVRFSQEEDINTIAKSYYLRELPIHLVVEMQDDLAAVRDQETQQGAVTVWIYHIEPNMDLPVVIGTLGVFVNENDDLAKNKLISGRPTALDPAADSCFELIRGCMDTCARKHRWCGPFKNDLPLPTRVIDVGDPDGTTEPYLLESKGRTGCWAALSHSWGSISQFTTTADTIEERKTSIPVSALPKSFADAVLVCRKLAIRYLWIDSICIIQGSKEDWAAEAGKMGYVYRSSYLTISAGTAANSTEGFLKRTPPRFEPIPVFYRSEKRRIQGQFFLRPTLPLWGLSVDGSQSKLSARGWILQERVLSPRTLHYGEHEILWECCSLRTSEGNVAPTYYRPGGIERNWDWTTNKTFMLPYKAALALEPPPAGGIRRAIDLMMEPKRFAVRALQAVLPGSYASQQVRSMASLQRLSYIGEPRIYYLRWYSLVANYCRRGLTFGSDKLVAIAGLASEFQKFFPRDTYVAGLWSDDILRGLLWRMEFKAFGVRSAVYRAPSWSWAALDGLVLMDHIADINLARGSGAQVFSIDIDHEGQNRFGPVLSGRLTIRGRWKALVWEDLTSDFQRTLQHNAALGDTEAVGQICLDDWIFDLDTEWDPSVLSSSGREIGILLVGKWGSGTARDNGVMNGLMLEQVESRKGEYRRMGKVNVMSDHKEWESRTMIIV